ncbi:MAG: helix-turn-helix transcriptional regulator, partial [Oscillospiraceae bacterium]|nr:helix-turn-helix transcriptional regulator [Oscillospiraceae bacterium]
GSKGYLRTIYRQCYGVTLHDDCTSARIARAQYLLSVTVMSLNEISERCGYHDAKYLMRQFQQRTGMTAMQYRSLTK